MRTHAPYGMGLVDDCTKCPLRKEGYFCQMADGSVAAFGKAKFTTSYPAGAVLFVEGQVPRGVYMLCQGPSEVDNRLRGRENDYAGRRIR